tara:strand:+ start:335 stop:1333 length:999 start_codon:yes stop_codon:yes gene_type:complete
MSIWLLFMFFLVALIIVIGGLTRLTDSGLSITEWELFIGIFPPLTQDKWDFYFNQYKQIPEFEQQNYLMTLEEFKIIFWWEWGHRFLGRLIGATFFIPLVYFTFKLKSKSLFILYIIFFLICFQGFVGWYMVTSGLVDKIDVSHFRLSAHLLIAFVILSLIFWTYLKINKKVRIKSQINPLIPLIFLILIFTQIVIGAFVSGMDAGKIYNSWPLMGETYFPDDNNFINLFKLSALNDPSLVQFMHRNLAYLISFYFLLIFYKIYKNKIYDLYKSINLLGFFILLQILLGILTILYGAQIIIASMHQISSIFLVTSSIYFYYINSETNLRPSV